MKLNIVGESVPTSFDVVCSNCSWTGVATLDMKKNMSIISVGDKITFTVKGEPQKCPECKVGDIYGESGTYKRNNKTNHMDRIGDFEE